MNGNKDYYQILGVKESATDAEIKKAYRKLAREHHPDATAGDKVSEERFKEISEAYDTLSDSAKRKEYDEQKAFARSGGPGPGFGGYQYRDFGGPGGGSFRAQDLGDLGDIFDLFGGLGGGAQPRGRARQGADLGSTVNISFDDAMQGISVPLTISGRAACTTCGGSGAKPGTLPKTCPTCGGRGTVSQNQGPFAFSRPCPQCQGKGTIVEEPCPTCHGSGVVNRTRKVTVKVPAGVNDGATIRYPGKGEAGPPGGRSGDLLLTVNVQPHKFFKRRDADILLDLPLTYTEAVLGTQVKVPTLDGSLTLKIPAGTADGKKFRLKGRGAPRLNKKGKGDMLVTAHIAVPPKVSSKEKELLTKLAEIGKDDPRKLFED